MSEDSSSNKDKSADGSSEMSEMVESSIDSTVQVDPIMHLQETWGSLSAAERKTQFANLPRTDAEELFLGLKPHDQAELLEEASPLERRSWMRMLAPDDAADVIQQMGTEHRSELLDVLDPQTRREVTALLAYAEDNAGGLMSSRFVRLRPDMSVDEAISYIRIQAKTQVETIYYAYVIEADQTLLGVVSFRELFATPPHKKIRDIMKTDLVKIPVNLDQEQIAKVFQQHDLIALPVIDEWQHIKGIVTHDDIASVIQEEATEDIQKLGAVEVLDLPYMKTGIFELIKKRAGWLLVLFVGEMLTFHTMRHFEDEISKAVVLSLFLPLIISSGGNSGSQACTLIIRAMALGEIRLKDWFRVLSRELFAGLCLGLILGSVGFFRVLIWPSREETFGPHFLLLAVTIGCSVVGVVLWGTITGSMLPFILRACRLDPAAASAPFVATLVDVTGLVIYFSLAALFLSGIML